ncbi:hypothetical protein AKJ16_DCAP22691 [Drosera capensis]
MAGSGSTTWPAMSFGAIFSFFALFSLLPLSVISFFPFIGQRWVYPSAIVDSTMGDGSVACFHFGLACLIQMLQTTAQKRERDEQNLIDSFIQQSISPFPRRGRVAELVDSAQQSQPEGREENCRNKESSASESIVGEEKKKKKKKKKKRGEEEEEAATWRRLRVLGISWEERENWSPRSAGQQLARLSALI